MYAVTAEEVAKAKGVPCVLHRLCLSACLSVVLLTTQNAARNGKGKLTADVQMYAVTAEEVAKAKGVPYVDMYSTIMGVKNWDVSMVPVVSSHQHCNWWRAGNSMLLVCLWPP
jgi:hypothetical protein